MLTTSITLHRKPKDGSSVTIISKSVTYQISASGTETPTGIWSDKVVATTDTKPYLWTRTIVVYSDTNSTTSYSVSYRGKDGAPGKDAVNINLSPSELVYNADKDGYISSTQFNNNTSTVSATRGGKAVSFTVSIVSKDNCEADFISSNVIKITKITTESVATGKDVPASAGGVKLKVTVDGTDYYSYLPFRVNTNTFVKTVLETDESFQRKYTEISNKYNTVSNELNDKASKDELMEVSSSIEQTAREISLSVSEKSVGRRNLLVGSAFNRQEGFGLQLDANVRGYGILMNDGVDGMNCIKVSSYYDGTRHQYCGAFWGGNHTKNIRIKHRTQYTFSCWVKVDEADTIVYLEVIYNRAEIGQDRDGRPTGTYLFAIKEPNKWQLVKWSFITDDTHDWIEANVFTSSDVAYKTFVARFCKPMLEEGDYNGWTLSEQDYDYVGGNMIDNARTLEVGGSLKSLNPNGLPDYERAYYGDCMALRIKNTNANNTYLVMEFATDSMELDVDYIFSFLAKGKANIGLYAQCDSNAEGDSVFSEDSVNQGTRLLNVRYASIIEIPNQLTTEYKRYWGHMRFHGHLPSKLYIQLNGAGEVYVCQPKLENGATMTEFTERKTDLVDKASLKAAGIEITSDMVELYGNQVKVSGAKGGTPVAMFENGMLNSNLINADKIMARQLDTTGSNGQRVSIEDGLLQIFGKNGACNIKFGVNDNGEAILSYYDMNGKWLYDLGPNKLDGSQLTSSTVTINEYVKATIKPGTNDFYNNVMYLGKEVKQVKSQYSQLLFGNNMFMNEDDEIKKNSSAHIGYQPFANVSNVTKLYRYSAPRMGNTIVKDDKYGLSTAELAKRADGKYFTSMNMASGGSLVNLAPVGVYFERNEAVRSAPYPFVSDGSTNDRFPAFTIGGLKISKAGVGSLIGAHNVFYSHLTRKVNIKIIS